MVAIASAKDGGTLYVYRYINGSYWELEAEIKQSGIQDMICSIDISNDTILAGSNINEDKELYAGAAYVYRFKSGIGWIEEAVLYASDPKFESLFGTSVSIDGNLAAIGADVSFYGYKRQGSVYIFQRQLDDTWIEKAKLQPSDGKLRDLFGISVSLDKNTLLVGAPYYGDTPHPGYAYIWKFTENNGWVEKAKVTASDWESSDGFGLSVSLSGDVALIGSVDDNDELGLAYIFQNINDEWLEQAKLLASDGFRGDSAGEFVTMDKSIGLVGARWHENVGAAYVFHNIAPLSLQIKGSCPGIMRVTVYGGETEIGDRLAVVYGTKKGSSEVVPYCAGLFVDIGEPVKIAGYGKADGMGEFSVVGKVPERGCGKILVQGVNITKCDKTERVLVLE